MPRAYQSPSIGTACGPQWAQMPNFASRNHSGHSYCLSDSSVGWKGPGATAKSAVAEGELGCAVRTTADASSAPANPKVCLVFMVYCLSCISKNTVTP